MATETKIGQLVIELQMKTQALEKGLETAKKKLQSIEQENKNVENSNKNLEGSFLAMSAVAVASLIKIVEVIKECTNTYNEYNNANVGLKSVLDGQGKSFAKAQSFIEDYISDGLIPLNNAVTSYKNLALRGYDDEQIIKTMINLKNAAAFGRQSTLEYGYAVQSATEGLKNFNPVLVDNAGVTKNMSVMYEEYARKIGKTVGALTEQEKILAEVNGITEETKYQTGDAAKYAETYSGQQAQLNAELLNMKKEAGESLIPILTELTKMLNSAATSTKNMIESNKTGTTGLIVFTTTLLAAGVAVGGIVKLIGLYKASALAATVQTQGFTLAILGNPLFMGTIAFAAIVAGISEITTKLKEQEEAQAKLEEVTQRYKKIKEGTYGYSNEEIQQIEADKAIIEQQISLLEQINNKNAKIKEIQERVMKNPINPDFSGINDLKKELNVLKNEYQDNVDANGKFGDSIDQLNERLKENQEQIEKSNVVKNTAKAFDTDSIKKKQQEAAQLKINVQELQGYLSTLKNGQKTSNEYQQALQAVSKKYPEAVSAAGPLIPVLEGIINAQELQADEAWNASQTSIQGHIKNIQAAINDEGIQKQVAENMGIAYDDKFKPKLQAILALLQAIGGYTPEEVPNIIPTTRKKTSSGSKSYQNKALDNYKKQIEYKKSLDQISLRDEINMYETALKRYAKTQDEKMELTTKLYELRKELTEKTLDDYTAQIDYEKSMGYISAQQEIERYEYAYRTYAKTFEQKRDLEVKIHDMRQALEEETMQMLKEQADKERELLNQKVEDYKNYIQEKKNLRGAEYDVKEQQADLDKIIQMHRNYLDKLVKDTRYTAEEIESIRREELDTIRDLEQQKRDLMVSSINNTVSQLKSAITKQIEEMQKADEEAIKKNIEAVEKWKDARIEAINEEYNARIKAIQDELDALDKSEQDKTRAEEDAEFEKKRKRLQELAEFEHDAVTKANYIKELAKLEEEYQKTLDKRVLADKKEALKEQQDLLKEEQTNKTDAIKEEADKQKEQYESQLDNLKEYYDKQKDMAQETAEKMLLNVKDNQEQILNLLSKYSDKWEVTGQTFGEKLAQGIENGLSLNLNIGNLIQKVQDKIDGAIEANIAKWTSAAYKYEQAASKAQVINKSVVVNQTNNIQQNPEMPSETYRKLKNVDRELAAGIHI